MRMKKRVWAGVLSMLFLAGFLTGCTKPAEGSSSADPDTSAAVSGGETTGASDIASTPEGAASADSAAPTAPASGGKPGDRTTGKADGKTTAASTASAVPAKPLPDEVATWFEGPLTDIFPATKKSASSLSAGRIDLLKNETESIQLGVRAGGQELTNLRVTVKPFSGKNAPTVMAAPIRLVYTSKTSRGFTAAGGFSAKYKRGDAPGDFPEYYDTNNNVVGLAKGVQYTLPANSSAGVVVEVTASASTPAGEYTTTVELAGDQGTRSIPITVKVWNAALPDPKNSTFSYTNWFSSANMNEAGFPSFMDAYYDAGSFNDNFFTVMANYAKVMKKQRQNVIYVPTMALLTSDMTIDGAGNYQFTFKNFDRYIETFIRNGSVKALEGGFFYEKDWYVNPPTQSNTWPEGSLVAPIFVKKGSGAATKWVSVESAEVSRHFDKLIPALYQHLKAKGWANMWLQHVCDEPLSDLQARQIDAMYKRILKEMPGVRTLDAGSHQLTNFPDRSLSINCPQLDDYERSRDGYNALNKANNGIDVWFYTCVNPQGNYMTRIADYPLLSARIIGWYGWQQGVKGYLHWGWNLWNQAMYARNDPFTDMFCEDAAADAFLVYPDAKNRSVFEGPRSTSVRDSWEDYELLTLASKKNAARVKQLTDALVKNGDTFTRDSGKLLDARLELIKIAAG